MSSIKHTQQFTIITRDMC